MNDQQPAPDSSPWLRVGALATDHGRSGIVQLLQDERGEICGGVIDHPARALLRPLRADQVPELPWWAAVEDLEQVIRE